MTTLIESYIKPEVKSFPFCPGCGHTTNLHHIDDAFKMLNLDPKKTVMVTDIGCVGLSDQYFNVHAFHGLHGRSITYATGIKLANPELDVIVLMGDGGTGIGGHHLISAARRNIGITVLVFNNFNFGMTGGEHSVTTPTGGLTATSRTGNLEYPLDICKLSEVAGAGFVARASSFDRDLPELMTKAIKYDGFSIIDIWEFCTAYYSPRNDLTKQKLLDMSSANDMPMGILTERKDRMGYSSNLLASAKKKSVPEVNLSARFSLPLKTRQAVVFAGGAGQKIKSTATLLAQACILSGGYASQKDDYPITVMTGYSISKIVLDAAEFQYTGTNPLAAILILSNEGLMREKSRIESASGNTLLLIDESVSEFKSGGTQLRFPFQSEVKSIDKKSISVLALGTLIAKTGWLEAEAVRESIRISQKAEFVELSIKAFDKGFEMGNAE